MKFGEIDAFQIIENEFRIKLLEHILDRLLEGNPELKSPNEEEMEAIRRTVMNELQLKYPKSGLSLTSADEAA